MALRATSLHPLTRPAFCTPYAPHVLATADALLSSACHCEPVRTLAWQSVLPAEEPGKSVVLRANSSCFSYLPKVFLFVLWYCKENGLPRRFAPRNDSGGGVIAPQCLAAADAHLPSACHCVLATADALLSSACHCEPVRTLAWQSVLPAEEPGKLAAVWANSHTPTKSVIANQCAHWCGNPRPRRRAWQVSCCLGKFVVLFVFAQSVPFRFVVLQGVRIATSLRSSQ